MTSICNLELKKGKTRTALSFSEGNRVFSAPAPHFMKSLYSIQKTPSLLPCAISSWRRCCGHSVHSSDQLPFQEKRPHGLRSRSSLGQRRRGTGGGKRGRRMVVRELFFSLSALTQDFEKTNKKHHHKVLKKTYIVLYIHIHA